MQRETRAGISLPGLGALFVAVLLTAPARAAEPESIYADDSDRFTLLDAHPFNRQLFLQLESAAEEYRLGGGFERFAVLADLAVGGQMTPDQSRQSRFHGYYVADTYLAVRATEGLEANLNLLLFNPSASDGYRVSSQVSAGLALHGYYTIEDVLDDELRLDLLATDLGWVTVGAGLLLEQTPLEGVRASGSLYGFTLDWMYGGRALWQDDDLIVTTLSFLDRLAALRLVQWQRSEQPVLALIAPDSDSPPIETAWFVGASTDLAFASRFHVAGEYALHLRDDPKSALLLRADYLEAEVAWLDLHLGYQFRWYENGAGPRDELSSPSLPFNVPRREDQYVTNSFEYLGLSGDFEQWSHTVMAEARVRPFWPLELFAEGEFWLRYAASRTIPRRVAYAPDGFRAPSRTLDVYYRMGLSIYPWQALPHRLNGFFTNKQVLSAPLSAQPLILRYDPGQYVVVELEAFL